MARDDFTQSVIREIAGRVGWQCSYPECKIRETVGPSNTRATGTSITGIAAHIAAAAANGPRYDRRMSPFERASASNGIWLCQVHAKLIDDDELRFPTHLLKRWKRSAEDRARRRQAGSEHIGLLNGLISLKRQTKNSGVEDVRGFIADFLHDVGAYALWDARKADQVRMLMLELAWNAFQHGNATFIELTSLRFCITLRADSDEFSIDDLESSQVPGGGSAALKATKRYYRDSLAIRQRRLAERAKWEVIDVSLAGPSDNPCGASSQRLKEVPSTALTHLKGCEEIHVYIRQNSSFSDIFAIERSIRDFGGGQRVVVHNASAQPALVDYIAELDNVRVAD